MTTRPGIITDDSPRNGRFMPPSRCLTPAAPLMVAIACDADGEALDPAPRRQYAWLTRDLDTGDLEVIA